MTLHSVATPPLERAAKIAANASVLELLARFHDWRMDRADLAMQRHLRALRDIRRRANLLAEELSSE